MGFGDRLRHAWNAFFTGDGRRRPEPMGNIGPGSSYRQDRLRMFISNERSILASILMRLAIDISSIDIRHARLDDDGRYLEDIDSGLNSCFTLQANIDQPGQMFRRDIAMTMLDRGSVAIVPIDTTVNPNLSGGWDVKTMRVAEIREWYPRKVRVWVYNDDERVGERQEVIVDKDIVAIVENPLYTVMNEFNSTLKRLIRKLNLLDVVDEQSASGKLDLIVQLPYVIKSEARRQQAEQRRRDLEFQLRGSQYGIAYTDGTEKITQLNRAAENNLMNQVEYLTRELYAQLGLTAEVMNGTADEATMLNYWNRTIKPCVSAIVEAMRPVFLTKTARSQGQSIVFFRDAFALVPIGGENGLGDVIDKLNRNEVISANESRQILGMRPSREPNADRLINSNMPGGNTTTPPNDTVVTDPRDS